MGNKIGAEVLCEYFGDIMIYFLKLRTIYKHPVNICSREEVSVDQVIFIFSWLSATVIFLQCQCLQYRK